MENGRCELRLTRRYEAAPAEVWRALTEPESLARWFGARRLPGEVRAVEAGRVLELDWQVPGEDESVVRFELSPDGDGTKLVLDHRRIEARLGMAYMQRWRLPLERLA